MKYLIALTGIIVITMCSYSLKGNNIQITNVSLEGQVFTDQYVFVEFDISWENSWRTSAIPANHDAAWIFVKYRLAGMEWHHMILNQAGYFSPSGSTIQITSDSVGAFIYRDSNGSGSVSWNDVRFKWDYGQAGIADDALVEVRVYGIEMVYILEDSFYVGDDSADYHFHQGNDSDSPYYITSEGSIVINNTSSSELWALAYIESGTLPAAYPKGYNDVYCMKYETSQEQYVEFINTLDRTQQNNRTGTNISGTPITNVYVMSNSSTKKNRNGIQCNTEIGTSDPVNFYCNYNGDGNINDWDDGQNIPCNFVSWLDAAAYLDWSGLRPMTSLEFEKICRGPNPVVKGEYVWGTTTILYANYTVVNQGTGDELIENMGNAVGNCFHMYSLQGIGSDNEGPLRCGIFAASSPNHTRVETGSAYYGVMEMGGNMPEIMVNNYDAAGRSFTGLHGNGALDVDGYADVDYWPGINGNGSESTPNGVYGGTTGVTDDAGIGIRGGFFSASDDQARISDRANPYGSLFTVRAEIFGIRGCRTAP